MAYLILVEAFKKDLVTDETKEVELMADAHTWVASSEGISDPDGKFYTWSDHTWHMYKEAVKHASPYDKSSWTQNQDRSAQRYDRQDYRYDRSDNRGNR